jgi:hypothetical protein
LTYSTNKVDVIRKEVRKTSLHCKLLSWNTFHGRRRNELAIVEAPRISPFPKRSVDAERPEQVWNGRHNLWVIEMMTWMEFWIHRSYLWWSLLKVPGQE